MMCFYYGACEEVILMIASVLGYDYIYQSIYGSLKTLQFNQKSHNSIILDGTL